jgi:hypothetical protein
MIALPRKERGARKRARLELAVALGISLLVGVTGAALAEDRVFIEVGCILASESGEHYDEQLALLRSHLQKMFRYPSYRLVKRENQGVEWGDPIHFEVPGGHTLKIRPMGRRGSDKIALNLSLMHDSEVLLKTDFLLGRRGRMILGGPRLDNGVLLIWVEARTKKEPRTPPVAAQAARTGPPEAMR